MNLRRVDKVRSGLARARAGPRGVPLELGDPVVEDREGNDDDERSVDLVLPQPGDEGDRLERLQAGGANNNGQRLARARPQSRRTFPSPISLRSVVLASWTRTTGWARDVLSDDATEAVLRERVCEIGRAHV